MTDADEKTIVISDIHSFVKHVLERSSEREFFYRGHASVDFALMPSIGRNVNYTEELEKSVFLEFKKNYYSYTDERPQSDIDLLFLGQHYGLPTRLLDWTYNPMIALYFACEENKDTDDKDGCIYAVSIPQDAKLCDSETSDKMPKTIDEVLKIKDRKFVVPNYTDARFKNQKALFILCDSPTEPLPIAKKAFVIKHDAKKQIAHDLAVLGYDRTLVYPLLESLCADIKKSKGFK